MARGTINRDRLKKDREDAKVGGFFKFDKEGEYLIFLCPPVEGYDLPYLEFYKHFSVGPSGGVGSCLDLRANSALTDPRLIAYLPNERMIEGGCPVCEEWEEATGERKDDIGRRKSYMMNIVPIGFRVDSDSDWTRSAPKIQLTEAPYGVWDGIMKVVFDEGDCVVDPEGAQLLVVTRTGTKFKTKYKVAPDTKSARTPYALPAEFIAQLDAALAKGGSADLFKRAAQSVQSRKQLFEMKAGKAKDGGDAPREGRSTEQPRRRRSADEAPTCFKQDYTDDDTCAKCKWRKPCSSHLGDELFPGHELREGDIGYEPPNVDEPVEDDEPLEDGVEGDEGDDAEDMVVDLVENLGFTELQVDKMTDATVGMIYEHRYPATATSILPDGGYKVFFDKLPEGHPERTVTEPTGPKTRRRRPAAEAGEAEKVDDTTTTPADPPVDEDEDPVKKLQRQLNEAKKKRASAGKA